ncbi:MAG: PDZ domain-containing protein [Phycisphaerales bacterium]|nr:MAG: PDZ domain-containing protein [Phycisphaerales bacterium]
MKTARASIIVLALALCLATTVRGANSDESVRRPWMGVLLDTRPLPDLLTKHLGLAPGQGIRVGNVHRDSPADKAGLERDDIIISFQGKEVTDYGAFVEDVRKAGVGTEVSLAIIHLGQRQTVKLELESSADTVDLKYPPEPQMVQSWRPGKIFRFQPGDKDWVEILRDRIPPTFETNIKRFFDEMTIYHHSNGEDYTITVRGNPDDEDLTVIVRAGPAEYKTTAKDIDRLPEKYRKAAKRAVESHRRSERFDTRTTPPSGGWRSYLDKLRSRGGASARPSGPDDQRFDKMQEQMRQMQQRLDELEKQLKRNTRFVEPGEKI